MANLGMKPQLLERKNPDVWKLEYPLFVSPKLDGIRCLLDYPEVLTRSLKKVPNKFICRELGGMSLTGLDGELIVGNPWDEDVFNKTTSAVRRVEGEPDFTYYVFDSWDNPKTPYGVKISELEYFCHQLHPRVKFLKSELVDNVYELLEKEQMYLDFGYEGVIIRDPRGLYKYGRTTMKEHNAFKLKRFTDAEAWVTGMIPKYRNDNEAQTNELGRTFRSKVKEGLVELETMGALVVEDCETNATFQIGSGFSDADRAWWYRNWPTIARDRHPITYKKFLVGEVNKPRHPIFKGLRMKEDV